MGVSCCIKFKCDTGGEELYKEIDVYNLTHNLTEMAAECGLYEPLWRPYITAGKKEGDEIYCYEIVECLKKGIECAKANEKKLRELSPENGWGTYEGLLRSATKLLELCEKYPKGIVEVDR
jgi:hypothetical protein